MRPRSKSGRLARVGVAAAVAASGVVVMTQAPASAATWQLRDLNASGVNANSLAQELAGEGVTIQSATFTGDNKQAGLFSGPGVFDNIGLFDGVVLSTGNIADVKGPNTDSGKSESFFPGDGDPDLDDLIDDTTYDAAVLEIEFIPTSTDLEISYVFASEEYLEYVDEGYNDVFAFFVNGENCATVATASGPVPVSVDSINDKRNQQIYVDNPDGSDGGPFSIEFDGFTRPLTCFAEVKPNEVNTLKLAVADVGDRILDSAVFLEASGVVSTPKTNYSPLPVPQRAYDSRPIGKIPAGGTINLPLAGKYGIPKNAVSVALNVTSTRSEADGYLTVYPKGEPLPTASNVNYPAGVDVPNVVVAKLGDDGSVNIFSEQPTDVIVDVFGWFAVDAVNGFTPVVPARVADTRGGARLGAGEVVTFQVAGVAGIPTGVRSVALNLTINDAESGGWAAAYAAGGPQPQTSNVNFVAGETRPNVVFAPVSADGKVSVYVSAGAHVIADVLGSYNTGSNAELFKPVRPRRVWDSRQNEIIPTDGVLTLKVTDIVGVPSTASAVILNVTVAAPEAPGYLTVFPANVKRPDASNLNFVTGQVVPNVVISGVSTAGEIKIYTSAQTHIIVDVAGWFG